MEKFVWIEPTQINFDFECEREILVKENDKKFAERRFERINNKIAAKTYNIYEDIPENKRIFIYGFKHIKTDKTDNYILIGCESDVLYENSKLFNFWSNKFVKKTDGKDRFQNNKMAFYDLG